MKDDIVWVLCNKVYWPAVVTNVNKKRRKAYIKTVNSPQEIKAIQIGFSSLIDFEDGKRNRQLFELGKRACSNFQSVYDKVKQFYVKKHHQHNLSAARYLTFDPSDILHGSIPDADVSENSNSTFSEQPECPLSGKEIKSDSENASDGSVPIQKSQQSYSAVAEDDITPCCSTVLSKDELRQK
ncbi:hypothetical protein L798_06067 [Zootermopsis nevadensis]|uniref:PWWP domain-containing protein n=2 Tax=Zootermopsis nevadensis TaxID=136037 RepID=A0A067RJ02_ZOONE|nr:hypothetical protein L798_06067 [Zootermopsis nevadensis]